MVVLTGSAVATVLNGGKEANEGAALGVTLGSVASVSGLPSAVGGATGTAASAGAITGAVKGGTAESAVTAAAAAGTAASGVGLTGYAGSSLATGVTTGGLGLLALGLKQDDKVTYDCWKPVVHEMSEKPSNGMLLKDLVCHPNVAKYTVTRGEYAGLPYIVVENIWKEKFEIQYIVFHDSGKIVCHANPLKV